MSEQPHEERMQNQGESLKQPMTSVEASSAMIIGDRDDQKHSTEVLIQVTTANDVEGSTDEGPPPLKKARLADSIGSCEAQTANASGTTGPAVPSTSALPPPGSTVDTPAHAPAATRATIFSPNPPAENNTSASTAESAPAPSTTSAFPPGAHPLSAAAGASSISATSVSAQYPSVTSSTATPVTATTQSSLLLPDYATVRQTVRDMLALLQTYGPLTEGQLEYNLPPVVQQHQNSAEDVTVSTQQWKISDILELLVALGLVQKVDHSSSNHNHNAANSTNTTDPSTVNASGTTTTVAAPTDANHPATAPVPAQQYCVCGGVPRANVVLPSDVMADITTAHREAARSWQRSRVLQKALLNTWSAKTVLEQLLKEFPEIGNDPVYRAALRNCHVSVVDTTAASSKKSSGGSSKRAATAAQSSGAGGSTKTKVAPKLTAAAAPKAAARGPSPSSIAAAAAAKIVHAQKQLTSQQQQQQQQAINISNSPIATLPTQPVSTSALTSQQQQQQVTNNSNSPIATLPTQQVSTSALTSQQQQLQLQQATNNSNSPIATLPTQQVSTTATSKTAPAPTAASAAPSTTVQPPPPPSAAAAAAAATTTTSPAAPAVEHPQPPPKTDNEKSLTKQEMDTS